MDKRVICRRNAGSLCKSIFQKMNYIHNNPVEAGIVVSKLKLYE